MRNNDDGLAVLFHFAQDVEKRLDLLRGQNGGRFVQDQNIGAAEQHFDDLHRLLFTDRHFVDQLVGVYLKTVTRTHFAHFGSNFLD